ncbi:uncharacterized protein KD926_003265 [Aspergillus affinis]|uniref:uncharacterized protein n=1 Tax=Aspergillus affinis TaxID=1070780 RepID=UPI0022FE9235|nr:uncharacterized protein KD926_003265 [Aspergillus affinis]KAI9035563.1 hypothetical protein KD926_003265 [Aspergillus affinis]
MNQILEAVRYWLGSAKQTSRRNDLDPYEAFPVHFIDQAGIIRDSIITYTFRYNYILEPTKLQDALVRLLQSGDWRKMSGRLRRQIDGQLVIHVYANVKDHPPIRFSHVSYDVPVHEHPLGCRLPQPTGSTPSIQEGWHQFRAFSVPPDLPNHISHYLRSDEPLLSLRIVSFADTTLVSITFPHAVTDAMGTAGFLRAWSAMLRERPDEVPPLLGAKADILASVGSGDDEQAQCPYVLEHWRLRGLALVRLILRVGWDRLTERNIQVRTIYLPVAFVAELRQIAQSECSHQPGKEEKSAPTFLSDGDLIAAWGAQMILCARAQRQRPAIICNVFDLRRRVAGLSPRSGGVFLQNLILPVTTVIGPAPHGEDSSIVSVGHLACRIRQTIWEQATDGQARRLLRVVRATIAKTGLMPLFGRADATIIACTNWSKANFRDAAHFGPSAARHSSGPEDESGACVAYAGTTMGTTDHPRDTLVIYGQDNAGNYWIHGYLRDETWTLIQRVFGSRQPGAST